MSQSVFPNNDESAFKASQTASSAAPVNFQQDDTRFKATGMVAAQPLAFGAAPGMGPAPTMPFSMSAGVGPQLSQMPMPKQGYPQQEAVQFGGLPAKAAGPTLTIVQREPSTEPAPGIRKMDVNLMRSAISTATPDEAIGAFMRACNEMRILDVQENGFKLEGRYFDESHKMAEFYVGIYTTIEDRNTVVEINSSQGPVFQEFLSNIFGRMKGLADFETHVNTEQAYNWSPLPLPILGMEEDTPSSPDVGGTLTDVPAMLPFGYPPEISLSLGFSVQDGDEDPDAQKRSYMEDLVESLETGYAREIADAAPNLAVESEDDDALRVLRTVDNVVNRLMALIMERKDACLVRSCVITLSNLMDSEEFAVNQPKDEIRNNLLEVSGKWSDRQNTMVEGEFIPKSEEIKRQINDVMMKL